MPQRRAQARSPGPEGSQPSLALDSDQRRTYNAAVGDVDACSERLGPGSHHRLDTGQLAGPLSHERGDDGGQDVESVGAPLACVGEQRTAKGVALVLQVPIEQTLRLSLAWGHGVSRDDLADRCLVVCRGSDQVDADESAADEPTAGASVVLPHGHEDRDGADAALTDERPGVAGLAVEVLAGEDSVEVHNAITQRGDADADWRPVDVVARVHQHGRRERNERAGSTLSWFVWS